MGQETKISPETYARWRTSELGALTESLEKDAVFALAGNLAGKRMLDVGCGDGAYSIQAAQLGANVTGLDISPMTLDAARRRAEAAGVSLEWREGRAEALPFPAASFDVVIAVTVLCWVHDAAAAVREMALRRSARRPRGDRGTGALQPVGHRAQDARLVWVQILARGAFLDTGRAPPSGGVQSA
jgi:SAM-dependent methyltransferase